MNLPAPTYDAFNNIFSTYKTRPNEAILEFESALKQFFDAEATSTFTNCFTAIAIGLLYATHNKSKSVAIAALAYRRTTDIVLWAGLKPVYIDNDLETLCMCPYNLEKQLVKGNIGCVLIQHPMVNIIDPTIYTKLCEKYNVNIIFDSVEATGGNFNGKKIGNFGLLEAFSLHPSKVLNAAEGGVLTFGTKKNYHDFISFMETIGIRYESSKVKNMFGLEPVHAALGLASIRNYPNSRKQFKEHYDKYKRNLEGHRTYELIHYCDEQDPNYKTVLVKLKTNQCFFRKQLLVFLEERQIGARAYYSPLYSDIDDEEFPNAKLLSEKYIILPIGHSVTKKDIDFICASLFQFDEEILKKGG